MKDMYNNNSTIICMFGSPTRSMWLSYLCAKFYWNLCSCFCNKQVFLCFTILATLPFLFTLFVFWRIWPWMGGQTVYYYHY